MQKFRTDNSPNKGFNGLAGIAEFSPLLTYHTFWHSPASPDLNNAEITRPIWIPKNTNYGRLALFAL
jgi:hypothetical protein